MFFVITTAWKVYQGATTLKKLAESEAAQEKRKRAMHMLLKADERVREELHQAHHAVERWAHAVAHAAYEAERAARWGDAPIAALFEKVTYRDPSEHHNVLRALEAARAEAVPGHALGSIACDMADRLADVAHLYGSKEYAQILRDAVGGASKDGLDALGQTLDSLHALATDAARVRRLAEENSHRVNDNLLALRRVCSSPNHTSTPELETALLRVFVSIQS
jgi:hypothetical protein